MGIVSTGLARIGHQYADAVNFIEFVRQTLTYVATLDDVAVEMLSFNVEQPTGVYLDLVGRIVGAPAVIGEVNATQYFGFNGQDGAMDFGDTSDPGEGGYFREWDAPNWTQYNMSEAEYQQAITLQIMRNYSQCSVDEIINMIKLISTKVFTTSSANLRLTITPTVDYTRLERRLIEIFAPIPAGVALDIRNANGTLYNQQ